MTSFERVDLRIPPDEAVDVVREAVDDLRVVRTDGAVEFRTGTGFVVAAIRPTPESGTAKATLRYRVAPRLPVFLHGLSRGAEIRDALDAHRA
ncbi:hypothetical protein [Haladaptatus salinisoli]|uniref:hypothetical protein n=1 Tax=Haladaptatus salinisoli TaxID=2884876 RepID=UPI001D0AE5D0|nr:hypothetical protein [Haladaptatus salinisoli]